MPKLLLLSTNNTDKTIEVVVDGVRYEYWIRGDHASVERQFRRLLNKGATGNALNLLKANSYKYDNLSHPR